MYAIVDAISSLFAKKRQHGGTGSRISVLCLLGEEHDVSLIGRLCGDSGWDVCFALNLSEARRALARHRIQVVLLDRDLAGENWRRAMSHLTSCCTLLVSKVSDDYLWNEVVRHGGYDVLRKPLTEPDVTRAVRLAWSFWMSAHGHATVGEGCE